MKDTKWRGGIRKTTIKGHGDGKAKLGARTTGGPRKWIKYTGKRGGENLQNTEGVEGERRKENCNILNIENASQR